MSREPQITGKPSERVLLCGLLLADQVEESEGPLSEAAGLVKAAGSEVVGEPMLQRRAHPVASTLIGSGKVAEVKEAIELYEPDAVVVDNDLSPAQGRNLEKAWKLRVIDRSELIMDIFARRAHTRQARLQVELAQTEYLRPRLRRMWTHLERMEGAIGTRGPGETQLETDRRLINKRINDLRRELKEIENRKRRQVKTRDEEFTIGLVGYTNAGKSTLLNRLTGANVFAENLLFATLDTRTRRWRLNDGRHVLLSDTVGFLQRLPPHLVASFHATLEEALSVELLLHVVDASHPDAAVQLAAVDEVLGQLGGRTRSEILVLNKLDSVGDELEFVDTLRGEDEREVVAISAKTGMGIERLEAAVARRLDRRSALVRVRIPFEAGRVLAALRACSAIISEEHDATTGSTITARIPDREFGNLRRGAPTGVEFEVLEQPLERYFPAPEEPEDWESPAPDAPGAASESR